MSETFKRMALVPEALLTSMQQYQKQQITPQTKNLVRLDNEMGNILQDPSLTEDEKARLYSQTLQRYLTMYDKTNLPLPMIKTTQETIESQPELASSNNSDSNKMDNNIENEILESVPKAMKGRAENLVKKFKSNPTQLSWNDRGELISEGKVIPGTNVTDLVNDVLRPRKNFQPAGYETFIQGLAKINAPEDLIRNDARRKLLLEYRNNPSRPLVDTPKGRLFLPTPPSHRRSSTRRRLPTIANDRNSLSTPKRNWVEY